MITGHQQILECVPNFSEGRNQQVINKIYRSIAKSKVLDISSDPDHNRTVITFAGKPSAVISDAFMAIKTAAKLINLDHHQGIHPRIGATDVCPLVPISNITNAETVKLANQLAQQVAQKLQIPVYLYEAAATTPTRQNLANFRKLGYETLCKEISTNPNLKPDYGPQSLTPVGATAIGVRQPLIAYNVNLNSTNLQTAKTIAKTIRESNCGLPAVKALGLELKSQNCVQISMNLTNYQTTGIAKIYKEIAKLAAASKITIKESEIIGLVPAAAVTNIKPEDIKLPEPFKIIEDSIAKPPQKN